MQCSMLQRLMNYCSANVRCVVLTGCVHERTGADQILAVLWDMGRDWAVVAVGLAVLCLRL